jgi:small GTP-binding protein
MARPRRGSAASDATSVPEHQQVFITVSFCAAYHADCALGARFHVRLSCKGHPPWSFRRWKVCLHGFVENCFKRPLIPFSRSCLLHRFIKNEWRVLSSQTIGVEFSSKIVKIGTGARRKRIKLQLWDTAGTERFRSVSRSYYRGAAGAILVYDIASSASFNALPTFLMDARALASPNLTVILAGNKHDLDSDSPPATSSGHIPIPGSHDISQRQPATPSSVSSKQSSLPLDAGGSLRSRGGSINLGSNWTATASPEGEVTNEAASRWASKSNVPVAVEVSALSGENVDELFNRLARMILTKIELGEIDPDDPQSGIQYGDGGSWAASDGTSIKSGMTMEEGSIRRRNKGRTKGGTNGFLSGAREWEDVFRLSGSTSRRGRCC